MNKQWVYGLLTFSWIGLIAVTCSPAGVDGGGAGSGRAGAGGRGGGGAGTGGGAGNAGATGGRATDAGAGTGAMGGGIGFGGFMFVDALERTDATDPGNHEGPPRDALEECGATVFQIDRKPPEVIIVFDRSGSMMRNPAGQCLSISANRGGCGPTPMGASPSRWSIAMDALNGVIGTTEADIAWGLKMYPTCRHPNPPNGNLDFRCELPVGTQNACAVTGMETAPALSQFARLRQAYTTAVPEVDSGATPTHLALARARQMLQALQTTNDKYLLLVTDGTPNCGTYDGNNCPVGSNCLSCVVGQPCDSVPAFAESTMEVAMAAAAGIPTFVVAFAVADTPAAHMGLNAMAEAGGRARDGDRKYYSADNRDSLQATLNAIAASTISCVFPLDEPPPMDSLARVTVNGNVVLEESAQNGWSFGPGRNSIRFNGMACDDLKQGKFTRTEVTFSCPGKPLPEPPPPPD